MRRPLCWLAPVARGNRCRADAETDNRCVSTRGSPVPLTGDRRCAIIHLIPVRVSCTGVRRIDSSVRAIWVEARTMTRATAREQRQQIDRLPDDVVEQIADSAHEPPQNEWAEE